MKKKQKIKIRRLKKSGELNDRMILFAQLYAKSGNATQSYIDAGYATTRKSARANACRLIANDSIQELVQNDRSEIIKKYEVTQDKILTELKTVAFSNIRDYLYYDDRKVKLFKITDLDNLKTSAIKSVKKSTSRTGRIIIALELYDKADALIKLGEYLSMWKARESGETEIHVTMVDARKAS